MHIIKISGGLGNQLFQYSFFLAISDKFPKQICKLDISSYRLYEPHNGFELKSIFPNLHLPIISNFEQFLLKNYIKFIQKLNITPFQKINEKRLIFNTKYLENDSPTIFEGFWQSPKYFRDIERNIHDAFIFPLLSSKKNNSIQKKILATESVSIHVRRGDYVKTTSMLAKAGSVCGLIYYQNAINQIKAVTDNPHFFIFSDDPYWCKKNLLLRNSTIIDWNKNENAYKDMQLMMHCQHNIIANSSFSWWGAYLNKNPNKLVLAPSNWFNTGAVDYNLDDILPSNWIRINTNSL